MASISEDSTQDSNVQITLPYEVISPKGAMLTRELVYGRKNRKTPFIRKELETAHWMVIDELDPDRLYMYSKTVLKNRVLAQYKALIHSSTAAKMGEDFSKCNNSNKEKIAEQFSSDLDFTLPPKSITVVNTDMKSGSTALILAGGYSGKTTMLVHALNNITDQERYDIIIIFTESINSDPLQDIESGNIILTNKFFPDVVSLAYRINKATHNRYHYLFVLDDVYDLRHNKVFQKMIMAYRNSNISTIIVTQHATVVSPNVRSSLHKIFFLGSKNESEKERAMSEWLNGYVKARGIKDKDTMKMWFTNNTRLGKKGQDNGKYVLLDNIKAEMSVQDRPKPKTFS